MALAKRNFSLNEIVFAKITGYCPWPCFITQIEESFAQVTFISKKKEWYVCYFNEFSK